MGKYFGTDGFRGEANVNLTAMHAFKVGRFLGWYYGRFHKCSVVIGKDTRRSSYMFEYALSAGLTSTGADVYLLHVTTTPSVSYVVRTEDFDCGIMISASHNPYYDNGIKLINGNGEKMEQEVIDKVEEYLDGDFDDVPYATMDKIGRTIDYFAGRNRYMGYLMTLAKNSFRNVRVGLDCSNGSASAIAKSVFDALGAETYVINNEPNGTNINMEAGSTHIEVLQKYVKDNKLDIGFAYDGEGYYELSTETDDEYNIISQRIIRYDDKLNLSEDDILRNITCDGRVAYMLASDGYLYYTESFQNGGTYTDNVCRIRLSDYYKETVLAAPGAQRLSRYLDLLTIWSGDSDDYSYSGMCKYRNNLYLQTDNYKVFVLDLNTGTRRLLFSENYINGDISVIDGKVFYLNSDGNPVCFDNEKKIISERMFYAIASDREYIYCSNNSVTYRYEVSDLSEEKFADKGEAYMADRSCVYFGDGTYMDAYGKQVEIPQAEDGSIFLANGRVIVKNSDGTLEFSDK